MIKIPPVPNSPGIQGHGEGLDIDGQTFFYRVGKLIPRNEVAILKWEGNFWGREHGDVEFIAVCFENDELIVLGRDEKAGALKRFTSLLISDAIALKQHEDRECQRKIDEALKCKCGNVVIVLYDGQKKDECLDCFRKRQDAK